MKKIIAAVLAGTVAVGVCGCGADKKASEEIPTLTWYVPGDKQSDIATVMEKANETAVEKVGAKLNLEFIDTGAYSERMTMNMASGSDYDLCFTGWVNTYADAVTKGGLMDITDLIEKETPKLKESLPDYAWESAEINGRIYAVPNLQIFALPTGLAILKDVAEKYPFDFDSVQKMEDLEPFLKMVKEGEPGMIPFRYNWGPAMWYNGIYEDIAGGVAIKCDGSSHEVFFIRDTPEYRQAAKTLKSWYEKGYIREDIAGVTDDTVDYRAGKYAISCEGAKPGVKNDVEADLGREVIIKQMSAAYMPIDGGARTMNAVGINSKNPEKSVKMLELLNTDKDFYNLIAYGIKDKHYTLDSENKVEYIENSGYEPKMTWKFGNQFNAFLLKGQEDNVWKDTEKLNDEAIKSPLLGFNLDKTPIRNELSQISAVLKGFSLFTATDADWKAMSEKLDQAGRQKVLTEIQKQVDEFFASKK